jgi:hypothetical protein
VSPECQTYLRSYLVMPLYVPLPLVKATTHDEYKGFNLLIGTIYLYSYGRKRLKIYKGITAIISRRPHLPEAEWILSDDETGYRHRAKTG